MLRRFALSVCLLAFAGLVHAQNTTEFLVVASVLETKKACDEAFPATAANTSRAVEALRAKDKKLYAQAEQHKDFASMRKGASELLHSMPKSQLEQECASLAEASSSRR
jgi:hypothetical protein